MKILPHIGWAGNRQSACLSPESPLPSLLAAFPLAKDPSAVDEAGSVSLWIDQLQAGNTRAAEQLWERYFQRIVGLARTKLRGHVPRGGDEEDVALSALASFCQGVQEGRFPDLTDRDSLWRLLVVITARKAFRLIRDESRQKRGGGPSPHVTAPGALPDETMLEQVLDRGLTPEYAAEVTDECRRLLASLRDEELVSVALWKMQGYTNAEISQKLGCAPRSVDRKLQCIRTIWEKEAAG
jgi:DNA-directed RNA polymerase specialized sigma24 family protein